jgi:hypothetical protein
MGFIDSTTGEAAFTLNSCSTLLAALLMQLVATMESQEECLIKLTGDY